MEMIYKKFPHNPPLVFLDTNVVIEMADRLLSKDPAHRGSVLYNFLLKKVGDNKTKYEPSINK
jgi:hypothetical protein